VLVHASRKPSKGVDHESNFGPGGIRPRGNCNRVERDAAAGCLKGAVIGGVAGHYVGHHGVLGAGAGCLIGHHEATKHARERAERERAYEHGYYEGSGSSAPPR
jgi:hypothetical protein